ncbi:MAG TPA: coniferyl aldehyde dehydrogenase, partial [Steroidobacteraceae bacterium]|nr:coniferyl aldehyde dehydrogenase [Steroidobacteraceae bacterium]
MPPGIRGLLVGIPHTGCWQSHPNVGQTTDELPMTTASELHATFTQQLEASRSHPYASLEQRREWLATLQRVLYTRGAALGVSISSDFGHRSLFETDLLELFPSLEAIRHARRHLRAWMRPQRRTPSVWFLPASAEIRYQPLGVVGIIVPWNYPLYLVIGPLVSALAAGNRVIVKVSEHSVEFGELFARLVDQHFAPDVLRIAVGGIELAREFGRLPFDHLLFTGSTAVGREVMKAAAQNLTPVTLELGGKSPAIVCPDFDLATAAKRIVFGKLVNAGQTCIAPDYVLAPEECVSDLIAYMRAAAQSLYATGVASTDYTSIASDTHFSRLQSMLDDAVRQGAVAEPLLSAGKTDLPRRFSPVALRGVTDSMRVMQEEIFGPILPIVSYRSIEDAIEYVNRRDRPLAMYLFDRDRKHRDYILRRTASGGVTINDTLLHIAQDELPFGGVGASGMGRYHGVEGFKTFSQQRSVFTRGRVNATPLLYPP